MSPFISTCGRLTCPCSVSASSPTGTSTASPSASSSAESSDSSHVGTIAGGVIGGGVGTSLLGCLAFSLVRRRKKTNHVKIQLLEENRVVPFILSLEAQVLPSGLSEPSSRSPGGFPSAGKRARLASPASEELGAPSRDRVLTTEDSPPPANETPAVGGNIEPAIRDFVVEMTSRLREEWLNQHLPPGYSE